jgi:hypothetical protein
MEQSQKAGSEVASLGLNIDCNRNLGVFLDGFLLLDSVGNLLAREERFDLGLVRLC